MSKTNSIKVNDKVVQLVGPCVGKRFVVKEVEGNLIRVALNGKGFGEWSHKDYYMKVN